MTLIVIWLLTHHYSLTFHKGQYLGARCFQRELWWKWFLHNCLDSNATCNRSTPSQQKSTTWNVVSLDVYTTQNNKKKKWFYRVQNAYYLTSLYFVILNKLIYYFDWHLCNSCHRVSSQQINWINLSEINFTQRALVCFWIMLTWHNQTLVVISWFFSS